MKYSIAQAAQIVDKTRQTIYRHIKTKPISIEKDDEGNTFIDASELLRVYGDKINFDAFNTKNEIRITKEVTQGVTTSDSNIAVKLLEEQLKSAEMQLESKEVQMQRERELLQGQVNQLERSLDKAQDGYNHVTKLLEDQRSQDSGSNQLERSLKALESRIANQEEKSELRKEREAKILRHNKALKRALESEKSKSFFQKLFSN